MFKKCLLMPLDDCCLLQFCYCLYFCILRQKKKQYWSCSVIQFYASSDGKTKMYMNLFVYKWMDLNGVEQGA